MIVQAVCVFLAMAVIDYMWAKYVLTASSNKALLASVWAVPLAMLSGYTAISFVANPWMLIPAGVGAFVGTYFSMRQRSILEFFGVTKWIYSKQP